MAAALSLPPIVEGRHDGDRYWSGAGRYERGDRRDRRLNHWTYGARVDTARIRRMLAILDARWRGQRGKRYRTSRRVLTEIARSYNTVQRISFITKATIAARLGLHRNTVYLHCKWMTTLEVICQGLYEAPKGHEYKTYSVFGVPEMTGQLPMILTFRRRYSRYSRIVEISWGVRDLAIYGRRPCRLYPATIISFENRKIVHNTCDQDIYTSQRVQKGKYGTVPQSAIGSRHVGSWAASRGRNSRSPPSPALKRMIMAKQSGYEGIASRFSLSGENSDVVAVQRIRDIMAAYDQAFGHLPNYNPVRGHPRGRMRTRVLAISDKQWIELVHLVLSRPMLIGAVPMSDGRVFQLNFWWLMQEAPRLLGQLPKPKQAEPPTRSDRNSQQLQPRITPADRDQMIAETCAKNPELAQTLARWAKDMDEE